jgi:DNA-binding transcriptional MerR regulator
LKSRNSSDLRTVDVARRSGYSVQQVRNLERAGVLPPAGRTPSGYRIYSELHVHATLAYRALAAGTGPVEARRILRAATGHPRSDALALVDAAHARLDAERRELRLAMQAAGAIAAEPIDGVRPTDSMSIAELATALGVRPSTLRHWDAEGVWWSLAAVRYENRGATRPIGSETPASSTSYGWRVIESPPSRA